MTKTSLALTAAVLEQFDDWALSDTLFTEYANINEEAEAPTKHEFLVQPG